MSIQDQIETALSEALQPSHLEVINESHMHNVPPGAESHFKVVVVSGAFLEQDLVNRHRMINRASSPFVAVNALLQEEHDFGGSVTVQAGWAWRNAVGRLFRVGVHYLNGKSPQFEFFGRRAEQIGVGIWYDY